MNILQKLIQNEKNEGKSLRQISKDSGVEYTSISNYYHHNVEPRGKNLGLLATYFKTPFHQLQESYVSDSRKHMLSEKQQSVVEIAASLTDDEAQLLLDLLHSVRLRRSQAARGNSVSEAT